MNDAAQESQPFRQVGTILPDGTLCGAGICGKKGFVALGLRKQMRCMPKLRSLNGNPSGEIEDVLILVQVQPSCSPAKLLIEERIAVGLPVDRVLLARVRDLS